MSSPSDTTTSCLPVGPHDEKVVFPPGRPACLPDLYIQRDHPLHKGHGKAYYFIQDGSPKGMERVARIEHNEMEVPSGGEEDAIQKGFLKLMPGDGVYARLTTAPSSGLEDVPVCWLNGSELYPDELKKRALDVRDSVLGPRHLRSRLMPVGRGSARTGGTRFERDFPPNENVRGGRCYPYGTSYENIPKLYAPCAQGKRSRANPDVLSYRSDLLEVTLDLATRSIQSGPDEVAAGLRLNHELLNTPSVGVPANAFFGANQLNIAPAEETNSTTGLGSALGTAGIAHIDPMDSPAHFTNMICASDLPPGFDPGRFYVLYPGVFYDQDNFASFCFSGLRRHGGTPPVAPPNCPREYLEWATRVTLVSYPPSGAVSSSQRRVLCADGVGGYFSITPEMLVLEHCTSGDLNVNHATFVKEGLNVMYRISLMEFIARCMLLVACFVVRQLSVELDARIDSDAFLAAFSFSDCDGVRKRVGNWECGPGWRNSGHTDGTDDVRMGSPVSSPADADDPEVLDCPVSQSDYVAGKYGLWQAYCEKYSGHVPYAVAVKEDVRPLEGWDPADSNDKPPKVSTLKNPVSQPVAAPSPIPRSSPRVGINKSALPSPTPRSSPRAKDKGTPSTGGATPPDDQDDAESETDNSVIVNDWLKNQIHRTTDAHDRRDVGRFMRSHAWLEDEGVDNHAPSPATSRVGDCEGDGDTNDVAPTPASPDRNSEGATSRDGNFDTNNAFSPAATYPRSVGGIGDLDVTMGDTGEGSGTVSHASPYDMEDDFPGTLPYGSPIDEVQPISFQAEELQDEWRGLNTEQGYAADPQQSPQDIIMGCRMGDLLDTTEIDYEALSSLSDADFSLLGLAPETRDHHISRAPTPQNSVSRNTLPGYLKIITADAVYTDLMAIQTTAMEIASNSKPIVQTDPALLLDSLNTATHQKPLDSSIFGVIHSTRSELLGLEKAEMEGTLRIKQLRACIMMGNYECWRWIEDTIPKYVSSVLAQEDGVPGCPWLQSLIQDVGRGLARRDRSVPFFPEKYGVDLERDQRDYTINFTRYDYQTGRLDVISSSTMLAVCDVVSMWLDCVSRGTSYWRAVLVETLYLAVGEDAFVLDCVWKTYKAASRSMLGIRGNMSSLGIDVTAFPLFDPSSRMRQDMKKLADTVRTFTQEKGSRGGAVGGTSEVQACGVRIANSHIDAFKNFIADCFNFTFRHILSTNPSLNDVLTNESDRILPFREMAPSRRHVTEPGGPFSAENVRTVEGVFSALVSRATTFATKFSKEGRTMFTSPDDFFDATTELGCTDESEYCNPAAYGQKDKGRTADLVYDYWMAVNSDPPWPGLTKKEPISFAACYDYFLPAKGTPRFPHLGKLGAYLLTADYVYAGVVESPSIEVISGMVKRLNKGAMRALESLGLISMRKKGEKGKRSATRLSDVVAAFGSAHALVESSIPDVVQDEAGVNYIVTEHALCKFSRVTNKKTHIIRC